MYAKEFQKYNKNLYGLPHFSIRNKLLQCIKILKNIKPTLFCVK